MAHNKAMSYSGPGTHTLQLVSLTSGVTHMGKFTTRLEGARR